MFAAERNWQKFHLPRSLGLALVGEVGELAEILQFTSEENTTLPEVTTIDQLSQELADVTIYLIRLADVCNTSWDNN